MWVSIFPSDHPDAPRLFIRDQRPDRIGLLRPSIAGEEDMHTKLFVFARSKGRVKALGMDLRPKTYQASARKKVSGGHRMVMRDQAPGMTQGKQGLTETLAHSAMSLFASLAYTWSPPCSQANPFRVTVISPHYESCLSVC
ncbi:uncharacterized protein [Elaeis guineensis]|uniref:uncharacterized protein isoform X2 n=1 Tax=Elaeis guineensis var. tenera TaxID=51953 RepID=UPI003C6CF73E